MLHFLTMMYIVLVQAALLTHVLLRPQFSKSSYYSYSLALEIPSFYWWPMQNKFFVPATQINILLSFCLVANASFFPLLRKKEISEKIENTALRLYWIIPLFDPIPTYF